MKFKIYTAAHKIYGPLWAPRFDYTYVPRMAARYAYGHDAYELPIRVQVVPYRYRGKPTSIGISDHKALINILLVSRPHIQRNIDGRDVIINCLLC